jgi:hypothetical protein
MALKKLFSYLILSFILLSYQACTQKSDVVTIASILTQGTGTWKVSFAKFGDENAPTGMYDGFTLRFTNDGNYLRVNPNGAISPALLANGKWVQGTGNSIVFDGNITVREVSVALSNSKLVFEWEVSIPGKVTTTYRIELVRA